MKQWIEICFTQKNNRKHNKSTSIFWLAECLYHKESDANVIPLIVDYWYRYNNIALDYCQASSLIAPTVARARYEQPK